MHFNLIIATGLAGLTSAAPLVAKRDVAAIEADFTKISTQLTTLDTELVAFTGSVLNALAIYLGVETLETYIETATSDVTTNGALSADDSATLYASGQSAVTQLSGILTDIEAKVSVIESTGYTSLILSTLATVKSDADALFTALATNVDSSYADDLAALQATIDADYETVVAAFS